MKVARRIYIYLISYISLLLMLSGASDLLRLLLDAILGTPAPIVDASYQREQYSRAGAMLLVGAVVWAIHWMLAQRSVAGGGPEATEERLSVLRKLLIYGVLFTTAAQVFFALYGLIQGVLALHAGPGAESLSGVVSRTVPTLLVYGIGWLYYQQVRRRDNAVTPERGGAATVRRWYYYLVNFGALSFAMSGIAGLARYVWELITTGGAMGIVENTGLPWEFTTNTGWIIAGLGFWLVHWLPVQRLTAVSADEQHAVLRKVYLYGIIFETVAVTLTSVALFLYNLLRYLLGTNPLADSGKSLLTAAAEPLLTALVYGLFWAYHRRVLAWDAGLVGEEPRQAGIRRLYHYLVALIALAVLASGVTSMLRLLIDLWLGGSATSALNRQTWGDQISLFATLILVGAPVWYANWFRLQRWAMAADGSADRQAVLRRIYLFLILFASVITLLASTGWIIYQILRTLGESFSGSLISDMSWALGAAVTGAVLLAYHLRVLLGDQRAGTGAPVAPHGEPATVPAPVPDDALAVVVAVHSRNPPAIEEALGKLQDILPAGSVVEVLPAAHVTAGELRAWLAHHPIPPEPPALPSDSPPGSRPIPA
jgi:hypothetical protein